MTVYGKPGKRWSCFPPFPQTLEIDEADSHISTASTTTTRMNISSNRPAKGYAFWGQAQFLTTDHCSLSTGKVPTPPSKINK
jgi:hypothetical protein